MVVPDAENKRAQLVKEEEAEEERERGQMHLTKHFTETKRFSPLFTGGRFWVLKDEIHAITMNDLELSLINMKTSTLIATHKQTNEDIATFLVSPNEQLIATSNRNYMIRVFKLDVENFANMECLKMFKTPGHLTIELAFDATGFLCSNYPPVSRDFDLIHHSLDHHWETDHFSAGTFGI